MDHGQIDLKRCSLVRLTIDRNVSAGLFDHPVDRCEPQARALALLLGCEERLEDASLDLRAHSVASVGYCNHDKFAGPHSSVELGIALIKVGRARLKRNAPSFWHGVS